jgi:8-oxo-dGTP pyrophosphatase MutT (NUDIX family)
MEAIKIFSGDKIFHLTSIADNAVGEGIVSISVSSEKEMNTSYKKIQYDDKIKEVFWVNNDVAVLLRFFQSMFHVIEAAGGVVKNKKQEYLCIFRNGKWDLPKGKIERGEKIEDAAIREVEEECGVSQLTIKKKLPSTFHTYYMEEKPVLKRTYWFEMLCDDDSELTPQIEEGITDVRWIKKVDMNLVLDNTFTSVKDLLLNGIVF